MEDIFNKLILNNLTPNSYYILFCISENITPNDFVNKNLEVNRLKIDGWLKDNLDLTSKSIIFISEINSFFKKSKKKTSSILMGDSFLDQIKLYNEIFPNRKLSSGKYARVNVKTLENSFRWFFENYTYSWDVVLKATEKYVDEYSIRRYEYMRTAQYFIRKQGIFFNVIIQVIHDF